MVDVVSRLIPLLRHSYRRIRGAAAYALAAMGRKARMVVPALLDAHERDANGMALAALSFLDGARADPAIRRLVIASRMSALERLGPTLVPVLMEVLENPESS
ncbi:hypothetical protein DRW03_32165 [Corallococcus sp. H22C18031201]|nr:hypothetical protein DRW03_32165 [Corallococcus sp. H22C18031201]